MHAFMLHKAFIRQLPIIHIIFRLLALFLRYFPEAHIANRYKFFVSAEEGFVTA